MGPTLKQFTFVTIFACYLTLHLAFDPYNLQQIVRFDYYNLLTDAFLHGRLDVLSPQQHDLSLYHGKLYPYWGPGPVIFILPFYLLGSIFRLSAFYTLVAGVLNVIFFYKILQKFNQYFLLKLSALDECFLITSFALCSPNFYQSLAGYIWATSQVIATTYILVSLFFLFIFLQTKQFSRFFLSVLFFNLAWLSRYTLIFYGLLYLYPLYIMLKESGKQMVTKSVLVLAGMCLIAAVFLGTYNYLRFDNPLETGLRYQEPSARYTKVMHSGKLFSLNYIPYNAYYYFLHLPFRTQYPYLAFDYEGNSIFAVYPLFLCFFFIRKRDWLRKKYALLFSSLSALTILLIVVVLLMQPFTGWKQFGIRYFLDVIPLAFLIAGFTLKNIPNAMKIFLLIYGVLIQLIGIAAFYGG